MSINCCDRLLHCLLILLLSILMSACASTSTTIIDEEVVTNSKPMYNYKTLVFQDFELKRELFTDTRNDNQLNERERRYFRLPIELSEHVERHVKALRVYKNVVRSAEQSDSTLILKGRFIGVGRFKISIIATLNDSVTGQEVAYFKQTLWDVLDTTETINKLGSDIADFIDRIQYK